MSDFSNFTPFPKPPKREKKARKTLPKRSKKWKPATKREKDRMALLKQLPCVACSLTKNVQVHHICEAGRRKGHKFTLNLCFECHEGNICSIGNTKKTFIAKYGTELELLGKTNKMLLNLLNINNKDL